MAGCGYLCPQCEGRGFTDDGEACDWCSTPNSKPLAQTTDEDWIKEAHEGKCCADD